MPETATETPAPPVETDRPALNSIEEARTKQPGSLVRGGGAEHTRFVVHLHFEHLRNLTTLAVSATGGGLIALQAGLLEFDGFDGSPTAKAAVTALPLLCFAFAAVLSLLTQRTLIRDLGTTGEPSTAFAWMSEVSSALFGAGVGSAAAILLVFRLL